MGKIRDHKPVKYFCAVSFKQTPHLTSLRSELKELFGPIEQESDKYIFDTFTDYYKHEMGKNISKLFISFIDLRPPEAMADIKIKTNKLEANYLNADNREVNLDPGYITEAKLVLATTKDFSHRLYLGKGIYGDLHMKYMNNSFQAQPYTYPDYKQELVLNFFHDLRNSYRHQLQKLPVEK